MLNLTGRRIFLARGPVDMRRGVDTLANLVRNHLAEDPFAGDLYVFLARDRRRVKVLVWDQSGFWLCAKRLERGRYAPPPPPMVGRGAARPADPLSPAELYQLLEGIQVHHATYHPHYHRPRETAPEPAGSPAAQPATNESLAAAGCH